MILCGLACISFTSKAVHDPVSICSSKGELDLAGLPCDVILVSDRGEELHLSQVN